MNAGDPCLQPTIEGARGLDARTDDERVAKVRARLDAVSRDVWLDDDLVSLLGAYERARGEAIAATAAMEAIARTATEERLDRNAKLWTELDALRVELTTAQHVVGEGWFAGGVSLAEAIERKTRCLEEHAHALASEVDRWTARVKELERRIAGARGVLTGRAR